MFCRSLFVLFCWPSYCLSFLLRLTDCDYHFGVTQSLVFCVVFCRSLFVLFCWPSYCLSFLLRLTDSDYYFGVTQSLVFCVVFCRSLFVLLVLFYFLSFGHYIVSYFFDLRLLINPLVSSNFSYNR